MEDCSRGRLGVSTLPLTADFATAGTLQSTASRGHCGPERTRGMRTVELVASGAASAPVLKAFGPVQRHGSNNSSASGGFTSGLPTRRRVPGRRQQQQQQQALNQRGRASGTAQGSTGPLSKTSCTSGTSSLPRRPTIKDLLGVNPADILIPILSSPHKASDKPTTQNATRCESTSGGIPRLALVSVQNHPREEVDQPKQLLRQKSSLFSGLIARLLPHGGDGGASAAETVAINKEESVAHQEQRQHYGTGVHPAVGAEAARAPPASVEERARPPPGIIIRSNAPLVPAFNASLGDQPIWKPVVYESKPIYLLPDGTVSNVTNNAQAPSGVAPVPRDMQVDGTLSGCNAATDPPSPLPATHLSTSPSALPPFGDGGGPMQALSEVNCRAPPGSLEGIEGGLLQPPAPLPASSQPDEDDSSSKREVPLTNYQRYLKWKEQQHRQQLLYQQLRLQQQQRITSQWIKTIENLLPHTQPCSSNGPPPSTTAQRQLTQGTAWGKPYHEQHFYLQHHQQLVNPQRQSLELLQEQQQQQAGPQPQALSSQGGSLYSQQPPFGLREHGQYHPITPSQQLQMLDVQQQQYQQQQRLYQHGFKFDHEWQQQRYSEGHQAQRSPVQDVFDGVGQNTQKVTTPGLINQPPRPSEAQAEQSSWREMESWGSRDNGVHQPSQSEEYYGSTATPWHQQLDVENQEAPDGYSSGTPFHQYPTGAYAGGPLEIPHESQGTSWMSSGREAWGSNPSDSVNEDPRGPTPVAAATPAGQQLAEAQETNFVPNFFSQPAYTPQPPAFADAMRPISGAPFHPGFNYVEGISVHYNYYDAEEWTAKLQAAAATQRAYSGSTQSGADNEAPRDASGASYLVNSDLGDEPVADWGLKPLLTSKQRLPSGQVFVH